MSLSLIWFFEKLIKGRGIVAFISQEIAQIIMKKILMIWQDFTGKKIIFEKGDEIFYWKKYERKKCAIICSKIRKEKGDHNDCLCVDLSLKKKTPLFERGGGR